MRQPAWRHFPQPEAKRRMARGTAGRGQEARVRNSPRGGDFRLGRTAHRDSPSWKRANGSETRYLPLRAISFNSPYSYPVEINANEEPRRYCSIRGRSLRSWSANVNFATSGVFVSPSFKSLALQGLTDVVSQSPNSRPALWWLRRAAAVLRRAGRLCRLAVVGDSH